MRTSPSSNSERLENAREFFGTSGLEYVLRSVHRKRVPLFYVRHVAAIIRAITDRVAVPVESAEPPPGELGSRSAAPVSVSVTNLCQEPLLTRVIASTSWPS